MQEFIHLVDCARNEPLVEKDLKQALCVLKKIALMCLHKSESYFPTALYSERIIAKVAIKKYSRDLIIPTNTPWLEQFILLLKESAEKLIRKENGQFTSKKHCYDVLVELLDQGTMDEKEMEEFFATLGEILKSKLKKLGIKIKSIRKKPLV